MRIKEKTAFASCAKMSDEKIMNGDTQSCIQLKREHELEQDRRKNSRSPNSASEFETISLGGAKIKCFKGSSFNSNLSCKDSEKDDNSNPNSPHLFCGDSDTNITGGSGGGSSIYGGGRLKFFKDGKFILELSHRKDGEKTCWIPVPKKTFWPAIGTPRQESSASLSVSDDNSSVQSSPWQRDHCWKQTTPRRNINQELEFRLVRPLCIRKLRYTSQAVRAKRRKPTDLSKIEQGLLEKIHVKIRERIPLDGIVQSLWERVINTNKVESGIVSPRKRILRELERVSLEEASKRQRARPPARTVSCHSISAILAREDDSVLRTLLRSPPPSPESIRPQQTRLPSSQFLASPSHSLHNVYPPSSTSYYSQVPSPYRPSHNLWPVHYPTSSPNALPPPLYPVPHYHNAPWSHMHRNLQQDASPDVPLNLSKNSG